MVSREDLGLRIVYPFTDQSQDLAGRRGDFLSLGNSDYPVQGIDILDAIPMIMVVYQQSMRCFPSSRSARVVLPQSRMQEEEERVSRRFQGAAAGA